LARDTQDEAVYAKGDEKGGKTGAATASGDGIRRIAILLLPSFSSLILAVLNR